MMKPLTVQRMYCIDQNEKVIGRDLPTNQFGIFYQTLGKLRFRSDHPTFEREKLIIFYIIY